MAINSREKGKRWERKWRDKLREHGLHAERGQQFSGSPDSPDVKSNDLPSISFEVKGVENLNLREAMKQAIRDAGPLLIPVVAHHKNRQGWLVTMRGDDWIELVKESTLVASRPKDAATKLFVPPLHLDYP